MKKYILILILLIAGVKGYSQRMIYKQKAVEVSVGILNSKPIHKNYYVNLTLNSFVRHGNYWVYSGEYERKDISYKNQNIPLESYLGEIGFSKQLCTDRRKFIALNLGITGVAGYEIINQGDDILDDGAKLEDKNQFVYGAGGRLSVETYLSDRIVFLLQGRIKYLMGTDLERFRPSGGVGFRINF